MVRLRRPLIQGRILGAGAHPGVLLGAVLCAASGTLMLGDGNGSGALGMAVLALAATLAALWLRVFTAWAKFDEAGCTGASWLGRTAPVGFDVLLDRGSRRVQINLDTLCGAPEPDDS